jgi:hypothetical protein
LKPRQGGMLGNLGQQTSSQDEDDLDSLPSFLRRQK